MRSRFDSELYRLNLELIEMGSLIEGAITCAVRALIDRDKKSVDQAIDLDRAADQKEKEIENLCLKLLLQQQPVARDLRVISAALKMITDMERISDQAADISELATLLFDAPADRHLGQIEEMTAAAIQMVNDSIDSYVKKDLELANSVIAYDDVVDDLFSQIRAEVISLIRAEASSGEEAVDYLMIAKYLERIGDHAVNIAEWVVFSITGEHKSEEVGN